MHTTEMYLTGKVKVSALAPMPDAYHRTRIFANSPISQYASDISYKRLNFAPTPKVLHAAIFRQHTAKSSSDEIDSSHEQHNSD